MSPAPACYVCMTVGSGAFVPAAWCGRVEEPFTVLFVEDDTEVRESVAQLLVSKGFRMFVAPNGEESLRLLAENRVDALFTDIVMPGLNGIELVKQAKALYPDLKVMFMTGYYSRVAEAIKLGPLLYKPVRGDEIATELRQLIASG